MTPHEQTAFAGEEPPDPRSATPDLVTAIVEELERRGLPDGSWLVDLAEARRALDLTDQLLARLERAILSQHGGIHA